MNALLLALALTSIPLPGHSRIELLERKHALLQEMPTLTGPTTLIALSTVFAVLSTGLFAVTHYAAFLSGLVAGLYAVIFAAAHVGTGFPGSWLFARDWARRAQAKDELREIDRELRALDAYPSSSGSTSPDLPRTTW
jgi:hypothetical protein